ncbi:MAG: Holliday junction branch migration DNA helicase RuvB [Clostridiales bacterium]|nr:MAG: Holliday junction branch migration DNA helicase RuvB [Clostridiales bacterium]
MFTNNSRILTPNIQDSDSQIEKSLRPENFSNYIGQKNTVEKLNISIEAAKLRNDAVDHILLYGPPGLGKTTLSYIIANSMGVNVKVTSGPAIERPGELASILAKLKKNDVLFIDEIHRLNRSVEEVLYTALEDFAIDIVYGKGSDANSIRIDLEKFTLIGATTRYGMLSSPLRDRFGIICKLELYEVEDLVKIVNRSANILNINISLDASYEIARRSRGTPRIANRLLKRVRDYALVKNNGNITLDVANDTLNLYKIDKLGLDLVDRNLLESIYNNYNGGPVGLDALAASTGEEKATIEDVYEPYLMRIGFISRTPRGRIMLPKAYEHLGLKYVNSENNSDIKFKITDFIDDN